MSFVKCPDCGATASKKAYECPDCATPLRGRKPCPDCGYYLSVHDTECLECGRPYHAGCNFTAPAILIFLLIFGWALLEFLAEYTDPFR